ncbi:MAG: M3 family oligoendopeptidase, partial [Acetivibrio ethanolgignens]
MAEELLKREQVKKEDTWAIEDLFATEEEFFDAVDKLEKLISEFSVFTGEYLSQGGTKVLEYYKKLEEAWLLLDDTFAYASRNGDVDTANAHYQELRGKMTSVYNKFLEKNAPIETLIAKIEDAALEKLYAEAPELKNYKVSIDDTRRLRPHTLTAELEELLASAREMADGTEKAFSLLCNADFENPTVADEKGEMVKVSTGRFVPMLESPDARVRRDTFKAYYGRYEQYKNTFAALYEGKVKANCFYAKARKYDSALEAAVDVNNVPKEVYFNLIEAVHENMAYLHQYMALRKKLLKVDELHMYDIYVPIVGEMDAKIDYPQAQEEIKAALKVLGDEYVGLLEEGFTNRWIDKYENEGKRSGAYSAGNYSHHPYVLMNFQHNLDSEFTLVHEMGHALHSYFSAKNNNIMDSEYKIFVAEVASTCNEALLM